MISIICPVYNEQRYIEGCIKSIISQDYPKEDMEVLFVDGMSTDSTRKIIESYLPEYPFFRIIDNPDKIVPCAMNKGIDESRGDIIIRIDAHSKFPRNYFSELVKNLNNLGADNVGGLCHTLPANDSIVCRAIAGALSSSFGMGNSYFRIGASRVMQVDTVPFGCFHRDLFDRIGYFDEELIRNQDDEFNGRIIKNGGKIFLIPDIVISYYARDSVRKVYNMFYQYGLFKPLVNKKLGKPATVRQFFPLVFVSGLILGPLMGLISPWFLWVYLFVILTYIAIAVRFASKDSHNINMILTQVWVFFVIHFGYGWGYINGIFKILVNKSFSVRINR